MRFKSIYFLAAPLVVGLFYSALFLALPRFSFADDTPPPPSETTEEKPDLVVASLASEASGTHAVIYNADTQEAVLTMAIGEDRVYFYESQFEPGTYFLLSTTDLAACNTLMLDECRLQPGYYGETAFLVGDFHALAVIDAAANSAASTSSAFPLDSSSTIPVDPAPVSSTIPSALDAAITLADVLIIAPTSTDEAFFQVATTSSPIQSLIEDSAPAETVSNAPAQNTITATPEAPAPPPEAVSQNDPTVTPLISSEGNDQITNP